MSREANCIRRPRNVPFWRNRIIHNSMPRLNSVAMRLRSSLVACTVCLSSLRPRRWRFQGDLPNEIFSPFESPSPRYPTNCFHCSSGIFIIRVCLSLFGGVRDVHVFSVLRVLTRLIYGGTVINRNDKDARADTSPRGPYVVATTSQSEGGGARQNECSAIVEGNSATTVRTL
jgi:hypothetical protein